VCVCILEVSTVKCACDVLYCHLWPVGLYSIFPHYHINGRNIEKTFLKIKYVFWFPLQFCLKHFSFRDKFSKIFSYMYVGLHVKYTSFFSDFNETWIFLDGFFKNTQISNFVKILPMRTQLFHADGQTDMTKLVVAFRSFAKAPKKLLSPPIFEPRFLDCPSRF